jgi:hypothetical protein
MHHVCFTVLTNNEISKNLHEAYFERKKRTNVSIFVVTAVRGELNLFGICR